MSDRKSAKLTLVVDPAVIVEAKSYAAAHKTSVSALIEAYLKQLTHARPKGISENPKTWAPLTRKLLGSLHVRNAADLDYEQAKLRHLSKKHLHD